MAKAKISKQVVVYWTLMFVLTASAIFCLCANGVYVVDRMVHGNGCY